MTITPVATAELAEALALLYGPGGDTAHAFRMVARGELDPDGLLVARRDGLLAGAVFVNRLPGNVAVIWPPRAVDSQIEDALTAAALEHVAGVKAVQAFLPPEEVGRAAPLLRAGFRHVTRVWEMRLAATRQRSAEPCRPRKLHSPPREREATRSAGASRLTVVPYAGADPETFDTALVRAHDDSLDCPELNRVLTPDEVLTGYRDVAGDTSRWWLAVADGQPAGVLLLNGEELAFLGVVPEFRGHGVGRRLLDVALEITPRLSLIVDARNGPAIQLYRSAGLEVVGAREVFLHFPVSAAGTTGRKEPRS